MLTYMNMPTTVTIRTLQNIFMKVQAILRWAWLDVKRAVLGLVRKQF